MERTINEKKAWGNIFPLTITFILSVGGFGYAVKTNNIILGAIMLGLLMISVMYLCYNFYSLGWEYKIISMEDTPKP